MMMNIEYIVIYVISYAFKDIIRIILNHKPTQIIFITDNNLFRQSKCM